MLFRLVGVIHIILFLIIQTMEQLKDLQTLLSEVRKSRLRAEKGWKTALTMAIINLLLVLIVFILSF